MKFAIFLPNWVGDACMAIPALRAMRDGFSADTKFIAVSRPGPAALLAEQRWFDDWLVYKPHAQSPVYNRRRLLMALRAAQCDAAILMTNSLSSAVLSAIAGIPRRVGYARDARSWFLTDPLSVPKANGRPRPIPAIDYYLRIADCLGCPSIERQMELTVNDDYVSQADRLWETIGFSSQRQTVVINNNAASGDARVWPTEHVESLALKLVKNLDVQVLLHCNAQETVAANRIADQVNHPRIQSMGRISPLPIGLSQAIFARASNIVTTDSGGRHIAVAMNRPVVTLFGPTQPTWTTTYNIPEVVMQPEQSCGVCQKRGLRNQNGFGSGCECMRKINPQRVFMAIANQLKTEPIAA